jgi:hypothetical protein
MWGRGALALGIGLLLLGCATQAQKESARMEESIGSLTGQAEACWKKATSSDSYQVVKGKMAGPTERPSMMMMTNSSKPTPAETAALVAYHGDQLTPCRKEIVSGLGGVHPALQSAVVAGYSEYDASYAQLVTGKMTWGDFAAANGQYWNHFEARWSEAVRQIDAGLQDAHRYEVQQRQAAAAAMSQWAYQQQVISAMNRPVTTNCHRMGAYTNCTSQ